MSDLLKKHCVPCEGGTVPLFRKDAEELLSELNGPDAVGRGPDSSTRRGWTLAQNGKRISKEYKFKNFVEAMDFANKITPIAESEGHHPDLSVGWGRVGVELSTHAIGGLSINDFILAAKIDTIS